MLSAKDSSQLQRHLKQAAQLFKKRQAIWQAGNSIGATLTIEHRLFASLNILAHHAGCFLLDDWPAKPELEKIAVMACLQSRSQAAFKKAIHSIKAALENDEASDYGQLLHLASPKNISKKHLQILLDAELFNSPGINLTASRWSDTNLRYLALHSSVNLPAHVNASEQLMHNEVDVIRNQIVLNQNAADTALLGYLKDQINSSPYWAWLALLPSAQSKETFFNIAEANPEILCASVFNGTAETLTHLEDCLNKAHLAEQAAWCLEQLMGQPLTWQPAISDFETGETVNDGPLYPVMPEKRPTFKANLFLGKEKSSASFAQWLVQQNYQVQSVGWLHLSQLCQRMLPDYSQHWLHSQLSELEILLKPQVAHAA